MQYNPLLPEVKANPYPYYAYLREQAPAYQRLGFWAISRYDDVDFVAKHPQLFSSSTLISTLVGDMQVVPEVPALIAMDPPDHSRVRKLVNN